MMLSDQCRYYQRQIAFQVQYDGGKFSGFAYQEAEDTIEKHLFDALIKLRLIESRQVCHTVNLFSQAYLTIIFRLAIILVVDALIKVLAHLDKSYLSKLDPHSQHRFLQNSFLVIPTTSPPPIRRSKRSTMPLFSIKLCRKRFGY